MAPPEDLTFEWNPAARHPIPRSRLAVAAIAVSAVVLVLLVLFVVVVLLPLGHHVAPAGGGG